MSCRCARPTLDDPFGEAPGTGGQRPLAIVTGASSGIGLELARCCADSFLEQDFDDIRGVVDFRSISGTLYLIHAIARRMVAAGSGRILITGSVAGYAPAATRRSTTLRRRSSTRSRGPCATSLQAAASA
ncbi:MAG: hypothetical protein U1F49_14790 [Rubrivivax sp.]